MSTGEHIHGNKHSYCYHCRARLGLTYPLDATSMLRIKPRWAITSKSMSASITQGSPIACECQAIESPDRCLLWLLVHTTSGPLVGARLFFSKKRERKKKRKERSARAASIISDDICYSSKHFRTLPHEQWLCRRRRRRKKLFWQLGSVISRISDMAAQLVSYRMRFIIGIYRSNIS